MQRVRLYLSQSVTLVVLHLTYHCAHAQTRVPDMMRKGLPSSHGEQELKEMKEHHGTFLQRYAFCPVGCW